MSVGLLKKSAKKAGLKPGSPRYNAYVYSTEHRIELARKRKVKRQKPLWKK
jgi:hypothetical protein